VGTSDQSNVTRLVLDAGAGDPQAAEALLPLVYEHLRAIAHQRMNHESPGHTLQATALVHEAYLRLVGRQDVDWSCRAHFFAAAAEAMRLILLQHARDRGRIKRGGDRRRVAINVLELAADHDSEEILALIEAIRHLEEQDAQLGQIVRLRFYAGLGVEETAAALGLSERTVKRRWRLARVWLYGQLTDGEA
jgi:RNA polymerase sigma factor (TIGR02999 family)